MMSGWTMLRCAPLSFKSCRKQDLKTTDTPRTIVATQIVAATSNASIASNCVIPCKSVLLWCEFGVTRSLVVVHLCEKRL